MQFLPQRATFCSLQVEGQDDVTGEPLVQRDDDKPEAVRARLQERPMNRCEPSTRISIHRLSWYSEMDFVESSPFLEI